AAVAAVAPPGLPGLRRHQRSGVLPGDEPAECGEARCSEAVPGGVREGVYPGAAGATRGGTGEGPGAAVADAAVVTPTPPPGCPALAGRAGVRGANGTREAPGERPLGCRTEPPEPVPPPRRRPRGGAGGAPRRPRRHLRAERAVLQPRREPARHDRRLLPRPVH